VKITCQQQDLSRGLSVVSHAVSSRSTLPTLNNILLTTDQNRLKLSANNLEIGINCWIDADIREDGATTVPVRTFSELVNNLGPVQVALTVAADSHTTTIKTHDSNTTIKGMDPSEYPPVATINDAESPIILDTKLLKEMISQVAFVAAEDDSRPIYTAILVEVNNERITLTAIDSFRMAMRVAALPGYSTLPPNLLIPARTLTELARILPSEGSVEMLVTPNRNQVLFHTEHIDLVSRLIEGTMPNIRNAIPKDHTTRVVVETKALAAAVKRVTPFARDNSNITRIKIQGGDDSAEAGTMTLEASAEDLGSNVSTINAAIDGPAQQVIFNARYLSDVLAIIDTPEIAFELTSPTRPGIIKPVGSIDYTYVIMPMTSNR